ncbi:MAG: ArsR/SmtB family transcription factor [Promethearchaeota archaeon]
MKINIDRTVEVKKMLCSCDGMCDSGNYFENLQNFGIELKSDENFRDLEDFAGALASKERLIILKSLKEKDRCVCELETILDKSQSTISHHLRKLERANLIKSWKKGSYTYYGLEKDQLISYLEKLNTELEI